MALLGAILCPETCIYSERAVHAPGNATSGISNDAKSNSRLNYWYMGGLLGTLAVHQTEQMRKKQVKCEGCSDFCQVFLITTVVTVLGAAITVPFLRAYEVDYHKKLEEMCQQYALGEEGKRGLLKRIAAVEATDKSTRTSTAAPPDGDERSLVEFGNLFTLLLWMSGSKNERISTAKALEAIDERGKQKPEVDWALVRDVIEASDRDDSGEINLNEAVSMILLLYVSWGSVTAEQRARILFTFVDDDGDGFISPSELRSWVKSAVKLGLIDSKMIRDALPLPFRYFRTIRTKTISRGNGEPMTAVDFEANEEIWDMVARRLFKACDTNKDGRISPGEFAKLESQLDLSLLQFVHEEMDK